MRTPHPIAVTLRRARRDARLTQRAVARRAHVSHKSISHWETGYTAPTLDDASAWAGALGLRLALTEDAQPAAPEVTRV